MFKLSPFTALNEDQAAAVEELVGGLLADLEADVGGTIVVEGGPGTGKTILATYLIKLLVDIQKTTDDDEVPEDSRFSDFYALAW
jgi:DNA replication protein DnaC